MALWGKTDAVESRPKWINLDRFPAGTQLVFVDQTEAQQAANKARGITNAGWWLYRTYTDTNGSTRYDSECLVAFANTAVAAGDANDDAIVVDTTITITEQPQDIEVDALTAATFAVDYDNTGSTSIAIQWQSSASGSTWTDIAGATDFDLTVATDSPLFVTGMLFRAVLTGGGATATSNVAELTVTP